MAINFQVSEYLDLGRMPAERQPIVALPPLKAKRYVAVGRVDTFSPEARCFRIRNMGDDLWFRVTRVTDDDLAGDGQFDAEWLNTGDVVDFMLDNDVRPEAWQIDVRAR
jgi:hypothetical protein